MSVAAADLELTPSLDETRELAREHTLVPLRHTFIADCETPVSAYLKLRGDGPSFLLESAEQGQRVGRWSFLGFRPRAVIRLERGEHPDPYAAVAEELARYRIAPLEGLPPFAGGAVGMFGYDLVRSAEPSVGEPNPDETGMPELAVMVTDVLLAFDHLRHEVTVLANVVAEGDVERAYEEAAAAIADVRERLRGPVPQAGAGRREPPSFKSNLGSDGYAAGGRAREGVHPRGRHLPGGSEPALERRLPGRRLLDLPRPAGHQPEPVHVLPRLRGLRDRGGVARGARHRDRPDGAPAPDRGHAPARRLGRAGPRARPRAAGRPEGARRARDARGPRPQRPRARVRVRLGGGGRADGRGDLLARDAHRLVGVRHAPRRASRRWTRCAPRCRRARSRARRRSAPCRSSTSSSPWGAGRTAAPSATSRTRATSTPASTSAPRS